MVEEKNESTRNLLEQIEGEWDAPEPGEPRKAPSPEIQAALDAAADRLTESLDPPPISVPTMDELDSGWGDEDDDDEEDEDEDDEVEAELPDERLDPVAYAAAKKARDERIEARRQRRRVKLEAKKARRKARLDAQKQKQKGKQKKARNPAADAAKAKAAAKAEAKAARHAARASAARAGGGPSADVESDDDDEIAVAPTRAKAKLPPSRPIAKGGLSKTNQWMLAIAIVIFVAAAIFAAVVAR